MMTLEVSQSDRSRLILNLDGALGYESDEAPSAAAKKPKTATSKAASGSTMQDRAKKTAAAREEKVPTSAGAMEGDEGQPRKRTSSRLQGKGKGNEVTQSSATAPTSKSTSKSAHPKASEATDEADTEDEMDNSELRSRLKELTNEMAKVSLD